MQKILFDLSGAGQGYTGIGHDSRLVFSMLSADARLSLSGLIYPNDRVTMPRLREIGTDLPARTAAVLQATAPRPRPEPAGAFERFTAFRDEYFAALRSRHAVVRITDWAKSDAIWRILFDKSLAPQLRESILRHDFYVSDISFAQMIDRSAYFPRWSYKMIEARGFDAVVFPVPRPVRLPPGVRRIVRYHDAIPITHPDTVGGRWSALKREFSYTRFAAQDGIFICNSPMSRDDLDNLVPGAGDRAVTIPCAIESDGAASVVDEDVRRIIARRRVADVDASIRDRRMDQRMALGLATSTDIPLRYIIGVSALEPRKNFVNAIRAWEILRAQTGEDIRFVIVGSGGWLRDPILTAMRPHILAGHLYHLENVSALELRQLYRAAEVCLFPSFAEGFGFPPLEALQMETPSVVSDLPVFRWSLGDAAHFADPYDPLDISRQIAALLDIPENAGRRAAILGKAPAVLAQFSRSRISELWREFFEVTMNRLAAKAG